MRVSGFLSFRDTLFIPEEDITVVIGRNNTGKSNLVRLFSFLSDIYSGYNLSTALTALGRDPFFKGEDNINIELFAGPYRLALRINRWDGIEEKVMKNGRMILSFSKGQAVFNGKSRKLSRDSPATVQLGMARDLVSLIGKIGAFDISVEKAREASLPSAKINYRGEHFASELLRLYLRDSRIREALNTTISSIFPKITDVKIVMTETNMVSLKLYEGKLEFSLNEASDGVVAMLAYITIVLLAKNNRYSMIVIDEPAKHLHFHALNVLLEEMKATRIPLILTTHSPFVLSTVNMRKVRIAKKQYDATRFFKIRERFISEFEQEGIAPERLLYGLDESYMEPERS